MNQLSSFPTPQGQAAKKKMSKGCLVTLAVVGFFIFLILAAIALAFIYKSELAKYLTRNIIAGSKTAIAENPQNGVDTVYYNRIADGFVEKMTASEIDFAKYQAFFAEIQKAPQDGILDSVEAEMMIRAMIAYYPELSKISPEETKTDSIPVDSLQAEE